MGDGVRRLIGRGGGHQALAELGKGVRVNIGLGAFGDIAEAPNAADAAPVDPVGL